MTDEQVITTIKERHDEWLWLFHQAETDEVRAAASERVDLWRRAVEIAQAGLIHPIEELKNVTVGSVVVLFNIDDDGTQYGHETQTVFGAPTFSQRNLWKYFRVLWVKR